MAVIRVFFVASFWRFWSLVFCWRGGLVRDAVPGIAWPVAFPRTLKVSARTLPGAALLSCLAT